MTPSRSPLARGRRSAESSKLVRVPLVGSHLPTETAPEKEIRLMNPEPLQKWTDRIVIDEAILTGKPVIKRTRLAVAFIIDLLARGWSEAEILENYPGIAIEDIRACLAYASATQNKEKNVHQSP